MSDNQLRRIIFQNKTVIIPESISVLQVIKKAIRHQTFHFSDFFCFF
jgi:hypothetical protein